MTMRNVHTWCFEIVGAQENEIKSIEIESMKLK